MMELKETEFSFSAKSAPLKEGVGKPVACVLDLDMKPVGRCTHKPAVYSKDYDTPQGDHELWFAECKACGCHTFGLPSREKAVAAWNNGEVYDHWPIMEVEK